MNLKIELHYAVLINLLVLLWLSLEYMVGLQDMGKYINYQAYVTAVGLIIIPVFCLRKTFLEKIDQLNGKFTFKDAFFTGLKTTALAAILSIPVQLIFVKLINPDFFDHLIQYSVNTGSQTQETANKLFNAGTYLTESVVLTFFFGMVVTIILSWRMHTVK